MVTTLKALQDVLGRFQDREVQADMLRALGDEVARARRRRRGADGDGRARRAARGASRRRARAEFAERFAAFAAKAQRELVKETFG